MDVAVRELKAKLSADLAVGHRDALARGRALRAEQTGVRTLDADALAFAVS